MTSEASTAWDAAGYDDRFGYVSGLAAPVVELLDPRPGETVLDLGCGTGELSATIRDAGARVIAVDGDPPWSRRRPDGWGSR
jgi:2-polyprenyl-3-methyl-5-hydroxy-6-metoxy-1,4-benzoquinol methylase